MHYGIEVVLNTIKTGDQLFTDSSADYRAKLCQKNGLSTLHYLGRAKLVERGTPDCRGLNILIVEDDKQTLAALMNLIRRMGLGARVPSTRR